MTDTEKPTTTADVPTIEPSDVAERSTGGDDDAPVVTLPRRTIDKVLIGFGIVAVVVFASAGALLTWGASFANDYVHDELASQHVFFPDAAGLREEGRQDLLDHAGDQVDTGQEAQAFASYIEGHLEGIADGKTYAELDDRGAAAAVQEAIDSGASKAQIADLQEKADTVKGQRDSLFKGETLRGLLLSSYAWWTIGRIAAIAAVVAFGAAVVMGALTLAGIVHLRRAHS